MSIAVLDTDYQTQGPELIAMCSVAGLPVPQGSVRPVLSKTTGRTFVKQNPKMLDWRARVAEAARQVHLLRYVSDEPVRLVCRFILPRPKTAKKRVTGAALAAKRPDLSKLVRAVEDALTGVWYADDSLIVDEDASKRVAAYDGQQPGCVVELWSVR